MNVFVKEIIRIIIIGVGLIFLMKIMINTSVPVFQDNVKTALKNKKNLK